MHGQLVGNIVAVAGGFDGVDIADHVGDGHIRSGELLHIAKVAVEPGDGRGAAIGGHQFAAAAADGTVRMVVNFASRDIRGYLIQQGGHQTNEAGFGLAAQAQQDEVVARQDGIDHLGHHGVFVAQDAGKQVFPALDFADQIIAEFVLDGPVGEFGFREGTGAQIAKGTR